MRIVLGLYFLFTNIALAQSPIVELGTLPPEVSETSGLIFFNGHLITHNDSGGTATLFEIDTLTREIQRTVSVSNVTNTDWEAVTQDENFIYIGDFGNNLGTRQDLAVYRVAKADYLNSDSVEAETISFTYEDQTDFTDTGNSDWDAEAFFVLENELIILTKQWKSQGCVAYALPKDTGSHIATRRGAVETIGLVTDADYNTETGNLTVLGYSRFLMPFAKVYPLDATRIFGETGSDVTITIGLAQVEGLTHDGIGNYFFSSEFFSRQSPNVTSESRLFKFRLDEEVPSEPEPEPEPETEPGPNPNPSPDENEEELQIFKDQGTGEIRYLINSDNTIYGTRIYDVNGKTIWEQFTNTVSKEGVISQPISTAIYYFVVYFDNAISSKAFAVY